MCTYLGRSGVPLLAGHHADPRALITLLPAAPLPARRAAGRALRWVLLVPTGFPGAAVPVVGGRFHVARCDPQILSTRNSHAESSIRITSSEYRHNLHGPWQLMTRSVLGFRHFNMQQPQIQKLGVSSADADIVIRNIVSMEMSWLL